MLFIRLWKRALDYCRIRSMEIKYFGGTCIQISAGKGSTLVVDPISPISKIGPAAAKSAQVVLASQKSMSGEYDDAYTIKYPGEYEVANFIIQGYSADLFAPDQGDGQEKAVYYKVTTASGIDVAVVGAVSEASIDKMAEHLALTDVVVVPIGGAGYCFDAIAAAKLIKVLEPSIVIPVCYDDGGQYDVPLAPVSGFYEALGKDQPSQDDIVSSLKMKESPTSGTLTSISQLVRQ